MRSISDQEVMSILLNEHKLAASSLTNLVLESTNQFLRNDATVILTSTFNHQKQIFDMMNQKGWYKTSLASQQDISKAQQEVARINV
ncbi:MAG TPA: spore coat protein [Pseudobacteroides sp.]|uniref:spore coat protein n=1 Tax=Pseudobacteroides sp. TaxID=1968840 RepID=UPI002F91EF5C